MLNFNLNCLLLQSKWKKLKHDKKDLRNNCLIYGKLKLFFVISYLVQYWHCLRLHFVHFKLTQLDGKLDCKMCKEKH